MNTDEEMRELRLRIEKLEQAIRDADEAVGTAEGVSLSDYIRAELGDDAESAVVIDDLAGEGA